MDYRSVVCNRKPILPKLAEREREREKNPTETQRDAPRDTSRTTAQVGRRSAAPCPANCYGSRRGLGCGSRHVLGNARSVSVAWLCNSVVSGNSRGLVTHCVEVFGRPFV